MTAIRPSPGADGVGTAVGSASITNSEVSANPRSVPQPMKAQPVSTPYTSTVSPAGTVPSTAAPVDALWYTGASAIARTCPIGSYGSSPPLESPEPVVSSSVSFFKDVPG
ncbi:MAG: hypothetical protein BWY81_00175 [Firmicutes bacterium ADurb.Bin467]|nr:MAG: hypothetical protein BWY81_00175 [Firmicutes bacterium ADurb.Bin467]